MANKKEEIFPFVQILRFMGEMSESGREHISIFDLSDEGDATFSVQLRDLGLTAEQVSHICNFRSRSFINFLSELLIRPRFREFYEVLITLNNYANEMCSKFVHRDFGLKLRRNPDALELSFHVSLLRSLESERQAQEKAQDSDIEILPRKTAVK